ncbi:hypothetical protein SPFM20_00242 [Salmonella phage SPFM20]|nr:hypothetical protein SPFM20_00242 [Salmonella phage SPFM20]
MEIATDFFCSTLIELLSINGVSEEIRRRTDADLTQAYPSATNMMNQSREMNNILEEIDEYYSAFRGQTAVIGTDGWIVTLTACMNAENGHKGYVIGSVGSAMRNDYDEEDDIFPSLPKRICVAFTYYLYVDKKTNDLSSAISILAGFSMWDYPAEYAVYNMMDNLLIVLQLDIPGLPYEDNLQWHIKAQQGQRPSYKLSAILYTELGLHSTASFYCVDAMVLFRSLRVHEKTESKSLTKAPSQQWHVLYYHPDVPEKYRRLWFKEDQANNISRMLETLQKEGIDPLGVFMFEEIHPRLPDLLVAWNHQFVSGYKIFTYTCATAGQCIVRIEFDEKDKKTGEKVTKTKDISIGKNAEEVILKKAQELLSKIVSFILDDEIHFFGAKNYMDHRLCVYDVETNEMDGTKEPWTITSWIKQKYLKRWPNNISPNPKKNLRRVCTSPYVYWADLRTTDAQMAKTLQMGLGARFPEYRNHQEKKEFEEKGKCQELFIPRLVMRENLKRPVYVTREEEKENDFVLIKEVIHTKDGRHYAPEDVIAKECKHVAYATDVPTNQYSRHHI